MRKHRPTAAHMVCTDTNRGNYRPHLATNAVYRTHISVGFSHFINIIIGMSLQSQRTQLYKRNEKTLTTHERLVASLNNAHDLITECDTNKGLHKLGIALSAFRRQFTNDEGLWVNQRRWKSYIKETLQEHKIRDVLLQDPLTRYARDKYRGYPGDAVTIDFLYSGLSEPNSEEVGRELSAATSLGREIYRGINNYSVATAVRARKAKVTEALDTLPQRVKSPHILSVASGHLREAQDSQLLKSGDFGRFVALDQDRRSLDEVERTCGSYGVEPVHADARSLLYGRFNLRGFDLIYAMGLYDYLPDPIAARLTDALYDALNPGGRLIIGNFTPDCYELCYLEAYMNWWLVCRTPQQLESLARRYSDVSVHTDASTTDPIAYVEITRRPQLPVSRRLHPAARGPANAAPL